MNKQLKTIVIVFVSIVVGIGAIAYGAATAPKRQPVQSPTPIATPSAAPQKTSAPTPTPKIKVDLKTQLETEQPTITSAILMAYPKIATDYVLNQGQLFEEGQWYGTTLTYKGSDTMNRDTLRVLMQKKEGVWILRTTPPQLLLSTKKYPDVPKKVLQAINKAISLPGTDTSPTVNAAE